MKSPTLVVSDPPHGEVDLEAAAEHLELDAFAARLKARFPAPEVMSASAAGEAAGFAGALRNAGFNVAIVPGFVLAEVPWPDPVSSLTFDVAHVRATSGNEGIEIAYDAEVFGVYCRPPADRSLRPTIDLERAVASGHGPTVAEAIQRSTILDLYLEGEGRPRRVTVVPDHLKLDASDLMREVRRRFEGLRLDARLEGVRPRAPFVPGAGFDGSERRRYSFGTLMLRQVLESISPELRAIPQYEFGSRLAYALSPLGASSGSG